MSLVSFAVGDRVEPLDGLFRGTVIGIGNPGISASVGVARVCVVTDEMRDDLVSRGKTVYDAGEQAILRFPPDKLRRLDAVTLIAELDE